MKNIGYSDFVRICQIERGDDTWCDWLELRKDGVYVKEPDSDVYLTPEEYAVLTEHPTGNLNEPALRFPCSAEELIVFLASQAIGVEIDDIYLESNGSAEIGSPKPLQRQIWQEEEVLRAIKELGYDPKALPSYENGRPGVKAKVKKALGSKGMWAGETVFKKAWERLSNKGEIVYIKP